MSDVPRLTGFFLLGAISAGLNAFLLRRMIGRILRGGRRTLDAIGSYVGRLALCLLVFGFASLSGSALPLLVCALGFASIRALVLVWALRRPPR